MRAAWMSPDWSFIGAPRCRDDPTTGPPIFRPRIREAEYRAAMREVRPVTTGAAHGSGRLVLDAAARKLATSCSTTTTASCTIAHRPRAAAPAARFPTTNGD